MQWESDYGQAYMCMYGKTAVFGDESASCMCGRAADSVTDTDTICSEVV